MQNIIAVEETPEEVYEPASSNNDFDDFYINQREDVVKKPNNITTLPILSIEADKHMMEKDEVSKHSHTSKAKNSTPHTTVDIMVNSKTKKTIKAILPKKQGRKIEAKVSKRETPKDVVVYQPSKVQHIVSFHTIYDTKSLVKQEI